MASALRRLGLLSGFAPAVQPGLRRFIALLAGGETLAGLALTAHDAAARLPGALSLLGLFLGVGHRHAAEGTAGDRYIPWLNPCIVSGTMVPCI